MIIKTVIVVIVTLGQWSGSYSWQMGEVRWAERRIEAETDKDLKVAKVIKRRDSEATRMLPDPFLTKYYQWRSWALQKLKRRYGKTTDIYLALVPPTPYNKNFYLYGFSTVCLHEDGLPDFTLAAVEPVNEWGQDRSLEAGFTIEHELGHALGSLHDENGRNLMSTYLLSQCRYPDFNPHFSKKALGEMRQCKK